MAYNIQVSESYALDFLSILRIKSLQSNTEESQRLFDECYLYLKQQGGESFIKAYQSQEYVDLLNANLSVFRIVDEIKKVKTDALVVDKLNYDRFLCKQKIQDKYFGGGKSEEKIGYSKK